MENVTDATFAKTVLESDLPVAVDFWAPWCGPCRALAPILEEVAKELAGQVKVVKMNIDENPDTPAKYDIMSIPTVAVFKKGNETGRTVGVVAKEELIQRIKAALK